MGNSHRSASHLWDLALRKLFPKRASSSRETHSQSSWGGIESSKMDDHKDGFYKYSEEMLEEERREAIRMRSSDSTAESFESALQLMGPADRPTLPYTVSAPEWNIFSSYVRYLEEFESHALYDWLGSVLLVWSRVYTVSKVVIMAFMHYGVELEDLPDGILAHTRRAEQLVLCSSLAELVDNAENLYYALYSRLMMEIAAADLCATFSPVMRHPDRNKDDFHLPEPYQLCRVYLACKKVLDHPAVCVNLNKSLLKQHQDEYIYRAVEKVNHSGFILDDIIGYRPYAMSIASDETSDFHRKWTKASGVYQMPPEHILTLQSEKYLAYVPKAMVQQEVPALNLPFIDPRTVHPELWQREIILDNRQATLAKLEGKCVGDIRRQDDRRRLIDFVRERKCICRSICGCAWDCTLDVERPCPCSERMLSLMIAKRRKSVGPLPFGPRCATIAKAIFQGVASMRADTDEMELSAELDRAIMIFTEEIRKQRLA